MIFLGVQILTVAHYCVQYLCVMLKILFELFVLYLLYKLIFEFIIPLSQTTKQVKQKMNEMHHTMNEKMKQQNNSFNTAEKNNNTKKTSSDYIDYEEIK
jgi:type II secretory pathway component PulM